MLGKDGIEYQPPTVVEIAVLKDHNAHPSRVLYKTPILYGDLCRSPRNDQL